MLHRRSIRLKNYDYSRSGHYFVTICTYSKQELFGSIVNREMHLNEAGEIVKKCWLAIPDHYPDVQLDEFVVMPDHVHGILAIISPKKVFAQNNSQVGVQNFEPLPENYFRPVQTNQFQHIIPRSLGCIVRGFKIGVTKWFRIRSPGMVVWQRNYYERIIRDQEELNWIRHYIRTNPQNWRRVEADKGE